MHLLIEWGSKVLNPILTFKNKNRKEDLCKSAYVFKGYIFCYSVRLKIYAVFIMQTPCIHKIIKEKGGKMLMRKEESKTIVGNGSATNYRLG